MEFYDAIIGCFNLIYSMNMLNYIILCINWDFQIIDAFVLFVLGTVIYDTNRWKNHDTNR